MQRSRERRESKMNNKQLLANINQDLELQLNNTENRLLEANIVYENALQLKNLIEKKYIKTQLSICGVKIGDTIIHRLDTGNEKAILVSIDSSMFGVEITLRYFTKKGEPRRKVHYYDIESLKYMQSEQGEELTIDRYNNEYDKD
jgi:hypothetical protein